MFFQKCNYFVFLKTLEIEINPKNVSHQKYDILYCDKYLKKITIDCYKFVSLDSTIW